MLKIVVGGQLSKNENAKLIEEFGEGKVEVKILGDLQAAMAVKNKTADYYLGSCQTGAGGALAMAIAMLGYDKCISVAMVGKVLDDEEIVKAIADGKIAFGFVPEAAHTVIPVIMKELLKNVQE
ncbi:DUF2620 domain-containing protein [Anaerorhabdus sp.]|uniref:DUF2620 domain-containing protein n=1 Tax=Anaerorhabdus sp. TaxID=1872524 RepID=UPI002B20BEB1|nr:DUF2620 domain-containing protein [Anaerorhabdus sp.]MEA4874529.1 DUF2620 domain-containing protein [Anaerorhabdus sp.]